MNEKITAALRQVADNIDEVKNVDFKQEPEDIEYDLLGNQSYPRKSGIVDRLQDSFDELQNTIDDQEKELSDLQEFMKIILSKSYWSNRFDWIKGCNTPEEYNNIFVDKSKNRLNDTEFDLIKKVVEKYGKIS